MISVLPTRPLPGLPHADQKHEYADDAAVSLNPDPALAGWFPYGKDRNPQGGTAFHKFAGANRDLPMMMKELYPEPDLEVIGARHRQRHPHLPRHALNARSDVRPRPA